MGTVRYNTAAGNCDRRPAPTITPAYVQLWTPTNVLPTAFTLLEDELWAFRCHYWQHRTRACVGPVGGCDACAAGAGRRLTAWVAAINRATRQRVLLQLTTGALAGSLMLINHNGGLKGYIVHVRRRHDGKQAPVELDWSGLRDPAIPVVPPSTAKVLSAVWGYELAQVAALRVPAADLDVDLSARLVDNTGQ